MISYTKHVRTFFLVVCVNIGVSSAQAELIVSPFGLYGEGGISNGQSFLFGASGEIFEMDGFLGLGGEDLNGSDPGITQPLSFGPPSGIAYNFSYQLASDNSSISLFYTFSNETSVTLTGLRFLFFIDAQINSFVSTTDEYGTVLGVIGNGAADADPDAWEIDERGFINGNLFNNLRNGILDNANAIPSSSPQDVALALSFELGALAPLMSKTVTILVSDNGSSLGNFALKHHDLTELGDVLTISGQSSVLTGTAVPEPMTLLTFGMGMATLAGYSVHNRRTDSVQ